MDPARVAPGPDDADPELEELSELNDEGLFDSYESDTECDHSWSSPRRIVFGVGKVNSNFCLLPVSHLV